jgi:transposase-like protein
MTISLAYSVVPTTEICPDCKSEMALTRVTPILLIVGFEDVTYRCKVCRSEVRRTFERQSGAWKLVTLPSFLALHP